MSRSAELVVARRRRAESRSDSVSKAMEISNSFLPLSTRDD
jgi:hypothetical protein